MPLYSNLHAVVQKINWILLGMLLALFAQKCSVRPLVLICLGKKK